MKVGIIGAGSVGAACASAMLLRESCNEIVLNDIIEKRARGLAEDLSDGEPLCRSTRVHAGPISDLSDTQVVVIAAGINERSGKGLLAF